MHLCITFLNLYSRFGAGGLDKKQKRTLAHIENICSLSEPPPPSFLYPNPLMYVVYKI